MRRADPSNRNDYDCYASDPQQARLCLCGTAKVGGSCPRCTRGTAVSIPPIPTECDECGGTNISYLGTCVDCRAKELNHKQIMFCDGCRANVFSHVHIVDHDWLCDECYGFFKSTREALR